VWRPNATQSIHVKYYWEIIANRLSKAGLSLGYVSAVDSCGPNDFFVVDASSPFPERMDQ